MKKLFIVVLIMMLFINIPVFSMRAPPGREIPLLNKNDIIWKQDSSFLVNPIDENYSDIVYGEGLYVSIWKDCIKISKDYKNWDYTINLDHSILGNIYYYGGKFIVASYNRLFISEDGFDWTEIGFADNIKFLYSNNIVYNGNEYIIPCYDNKILFSYDGYEWEEKEMDTNIIRIVEWFKNKYIAVAYSWLDQKNKIYTSIDGKKWIEQCSFEYRSDESEMIIGDNSIAVVDNNYSYEHYTAYVHISNDGINWEKTYEVDSNISLTYGNGKYVAKLKSGQILISEDEGKTWVKKENSDLFQKIFYVNDHFAAPMTNQNFTYLKSQDGISWDVVKSEPLKPQENWFKDVCWAENRFVAVGGSSTIKYSDDGQLWVNVVTDTDEGFEGITYGKDSYIVVGEKGIVLKSRDAVTWEKRQICDENLLDVKFDGKQFIAVGEGGVIFTSVDGTNWDELDKLEFDIVSIFVEEGNYFLAGSQANIWHTKDFVSYDVGNTPVNIKIDCISGKDGLYVASGEEGVLLYSQDGTNWNLGKSNSVGSNDELKTIIPYDGGFVVAGTEILTSPDGMNWTNETNHYNEYAMTEESSKFWMMEEMHSYDNYPINGLACDENGNVIAVGYYGNIMRGKVRDVYAVAGEKVVVRLPSFKIIINGVEIKPTTSQYPFLEYKGITYFPMTWEYAKFLGLDTAFSLDKGLVVNKSERTLWELTEYQNNYYEKPAFQYVGTFPDFKICANNKLINNAEEEWPLFVYKDVTYFPLTWRFTVEEFDWEINFDTEEGLSIKSK